VRAALEKLKVSGMTVTDVRGHGRQKGHTAVYRGKEYDVTLLPKVEIEVVVPDEVVDEVIQTVIKAARTGEIGDGRVFVLPVDHGYNIRTGERDMLQRCRIVARAGSKNRQKHRPAPPPPGGAVLDTPTSHIARPDRPHRLVGASQH
jgi:nitrogen regulatory protein P-II 1